MVDYIFSIRVESCFAIVSNALSKLTFYTSPFFYIGVNGVCKVGVPTFAYVPITDLAFLVLDGNPV